jgi:Fur family ferric uptake transcriptional regulator
MNATLDPKALLTQRGLAVTAKRELVVQALAAAGCPLTPHELLDRLRGGMNRVTLYRILDLLVERGAAERHNTGERAFRYCLRRGPSGHAHFTCASCGRTSCLDSHELSASLSAFVAGLPMRVDTAEVRFGGVCQECLRA